MRSFTVKDETYKPAWIYRAFTKTTQEVICVKCEGVLAVGELVSIACFVDRGQHTICSGCADEIE